ncbi:selenium cofactor biosynthesis protein YqeC [Halorubrum sp. RMP-47]|uniref:Selenium cofactor biosynthesis protein YqeC n=1 Tax=Halorubrum miltondacostae TaxID=3076378 RepID=A0ABD5LYF4_9EURY
MDLTTALDARDATVCVVGAGGKRSTLFALADRLNRPVVTATVRIPIFDDRVAAVRVTDDLVTAVDGAGDGDWPLGLVSERERSDRYLGYDADTVAEVADAAPGATLVKADGARLREFKPPADHEPQIPANVDVVAPVASAQVVCEPLTEELVHRPEEVAAITGREVGDEIRPADVATVLASPAGGLKGVPGGATAIPIVNKVDDEADANAARAVAGEILMRANVPRVLLTRLTADDPLVEVVE